MLFRSSVIVCAALALGLSACSNIHPNAEPTASSTEPEPLTMPDDMDTLPLSLGDLKTTGYAGATKPRIDNVLPAAPADVDLARPCALMAPDVIATARVLGGDLTAFRLVSSADADQSVPGAGVQQTVAVYRDFPTAKAVFARMTDEVNQCRSSPDSAGLTFNMVNSVRLAWSGPARQPNAVCASDFRVTRNVVYVVTSVGVGNDPELAGATADQIKTNIIDPS